MKKLNLLLLMLFSYAAANAQSNQPVEMADALRGSGNIYVVVTIIAIIFAGLAVYLFSIDRRLKKLEKNS